MLYMPWKGVSHRATSVHMPYEDIWGGDRSLEKKGPKSVERQLMLLAPFLV